ncbi:MAG: 1,4-dihydroxy-2-naphthoate octaprenyltransferase [Salinivirgaceae bacterium]|nr:1,4-dihydroxy-2-naphthoate octaprenyltransferase [Salinivirgaceae bacterium]
MKIKSWIEAARLRTLPLSVSGIIVGCGMAFADNSFNGLLLALLLATTILLQVLGNFANDLGDFQHGTDNDSRVGPKRTLQGGGLTVGEMKRGIVIMIVLSLVVGITMLCVSFGISIGFWVFVAIGLAAIVAAIRYTMGRNPFGYRGLGDLMVLIFFGFATVTGSYFIMTHHVTIDSILMGTAIGFMSVGVLNVNNLRDCESDRESGKVTIVVKLGIRFGQIYHFVLCLSAIVLIAVTLVIEKRAVGMLWLLLPTILLIMHSLRVLRASDVKTLDPELKKLSLTTLLMSVLYVVAIIWR